GPSRVIHAAPQKRPSRWRRVVGQWLGFFSRDEGVFMNILYSQAERKLAELPFPIRVVLPDGTVLGAANPEVTLQAHSLSAINHCISGNIGLIGEDYVEGRIGLEGSMRQLMAAAQAIMGDSPVKPANANWLAKIKRRSQSVLQHTLEKDASQIQFHYDLSDD